MGEYQDEFKIAKVKFAKNLSHGITVDLDPETLKKLTAKANKKGVGTNALAKEWIIEHL